MVDNLETLAGRFFSEVGTLQPAGYRTVEVLLEKSVQPHFGGREYLLLAFSPEAAGEHAGAELVTYGSPLVDVMAEVAGIHAGECRPSLSDFPADKRTYP